MSRPEFYDEINKFIGRYDSNPLNGIVYLSIYIKFKSDSENYSTAQTFRAFKKFS